MKKHVPHVLCLTLGLVVLPHEVRGAWAPALNVAVLARTADVVVIGNAVSIQPVGRVTVDTAAGRLPAEIRAGTILVDQILKGSADLQSLPFQFAVPLTPVGYRGVGDNHYGVFLLKRQANHYEFLSPYYPVLPAVSARPVLDDVGVLERILAAQIAVLQADAAPADLKREAIFVLNNTGTQRSGTTAAALQSTLRDDDETVRLSAAAALLSQNDISALSVAEDALLHPNPRFETYAMNLRAAISQGLGDEAAIPALLRLLGNGDPSTREAACRALARSGSLRAIPGLVTALDDDALSVRYSAVAGLAELTGQVQRKPSRPAFLEDPARYVTFWKEWAKSR